MAALVAGYFLLHTFQGDRGLLAWMQLRQRVALAEVSLARLDDERARFEERTRRLSNATLDPDLLDERVRAVTGLGHPDEFVIFTRPEAGPETAAR